MYDRSNRIRVERCETSCWGANSSSHAEVLDCLGGRNEVVQSFLNTNHTIEPIHDIATAKKSKARLDFQSQHLRLKHFS